MQTTYTDEYIQDLFKNLCELSIEYEPSIKLVDTIKGLVEFNKSQNSEIYNNKNFVKTLLDKILDEENEEMKKIPFDHIIYVLTVFSTFNIEKNLWRNALNYDSVVIPKNCLERIFKRESKTLSKEFNASLFIHYLERIIFNLGLEFETEPLKKLISDAFLQIVKNNSQTF